MCPQQEMVNFEGLWMTQFGPLIYFVFAISSSIIY